MLDKLGIKWMNMVRSSTDKKCKEESELKNTIAKKKKTRRNQ